ncbi:MAG: hypothetical protein QOD77_1277 [Thermoplasmata archaeon]|jgi:hypothetical protein|nr:hypothetical protein [Thermoplasmata archaeon]
MRKLALLLAALLALAGCSGSDDGTTDDTHTDGTGHTHGTTGTTTGPTTTARPNEFPRIVLNVTANGAAGNVTVVGGNLTFDASQSFDPDGDGISAIAIALTDANGTMPARLLYSGGASTPQTFQMRVPGPVNVTVSAVDKRNGLTNLRTHAYVDLNLTLGAGANFQGALPSTVAEAESCEGASGVPQVDATNWAARLFPVYEGATYITATFVSGTGEIALCAPDGTAISGAATEGTVESNDGVVLAVPEGTASYFVSVYSGAPNQSVVVEVVVHSTMKAA